MTKTQKSLVWIGGLLGAGILLVGATAFADGKEGKEGCSKGQHAEARFKTSDKNNDGFLTADEVGEKRWARIKVADANADAKVSLAELKQAKADGKLGHHKGKRGKGKKKEQPATI